MPDPLWENVRHLFEPDGSLLDAYVFDTTVADWQNFVDLVRSAGWWFSYSEDGHAARLPERVEEVLARRSEMGVLLQVRPASEVLVNVHFFTEGEIEVDLDPRELRGQEQLNAVCAFLRVVSRRLGKPMVLTPENGAAHPLITYDLATDQILPLRV
ncbi:hypothetical protein [Actinomadura harenae]|uniref:Uncharacterized protein n=1 Tax=Actinomadura harenae TaxID=2483351 RepID=A0A3M2LV62_9ACTN|nr:hypothetical protein [Actinomadura harenae]RMI40996.1 hypothetical protein EBO15_24615 [Actinomadura harenae]